ncbi:MAG TPA: acyltransferase [Solirubrobacter sp.]|nr:acyltransferase [Solirubrobacter sp.]
MEVRGLARLRAAYYALRYRRFATFGDGVRVRGRLELRGPGRIEIGDHVTFDRFGGGNRIWVAEGGSVTIGAHCYVNGIDAYANEPVTIGEYCLIGSCHVMTSDFHAVARNRREPGAPIRTGPVRVGRNVWLADQTTLLRGVTIGDDSVVALGTVVTGDVPAGVVVAGQRMRVVRTLDR